MNNWDGILNLNKPEGISSREAGEYVKKILGVKKVGHAGTLDPMARGVLPLLLGEATKLNQFLSGMEKVYVFKMRLGVRTLTGDATGEVVETAPIPELTEDEVREVIERFKGEIFQSPHPFSAVKYKGKPLYKYAREGNLIKLEPRRVEIKEIHLLGFNGTEIDIRVRTSSGVYIRSLAEDIGKELGTVAYLTELTRLEVGHFKLSSAVLMENVERLFKIGELQKKIIPMTEAIEMKKIKISRQVALLVTKGAPITQILGPKFEIIEEGEKFALISENGKVLYAIAEKTEGGRFKYIRVFPDMLK